MNVLKDVLGSGGPVWHFHTHLKIFAGLEYVNQCIYWFFFFFCYYFLLDLGQESLEIQSSFILDIKLIPPGQNCSCFVPSWAPHARGVALGGRAGPCIISSGWFWHRRTCPGQGISSPWRMLRLKEASLKLLNRSGSLVLLQWVKQCP